LIADGCYRSRGQGGLNHVSCFRNPAELKQRLDAFDEVTRELMMEIVDEGCRRIPLLGQRERTAKLARFNCVS
jgi:hypothetical protein